VRVNLQSHFLEDRNSYNVLAEIPGVDPVLKNQVVMLGGHLDSWHVATGATDNAVGCAVMMEAARILKTLGVQPRRTIRVALWSGEEEGLLGSRGYVKKHFGFRDDEGRLQKLTEHARLAGYFNLDNGTGKVRGVYLQGNDAVAPIFRAWLKPFHELGATTLTLNDTGGTDHLSFDAVGLPGFQFIQDPVSYDSRTHHSNMDVWDHVVADDLKQASAIMAAFVWQTAQRDEMLPRKAVPDVIEPRRQR
jgi:Zn-dependent M28 family amino/carboxypeptidase